jgi:hypothetical protein
LAAPKAKVIAADPDHIEHIAANVRPGDMAEMAALGLSPALTLRLSLQTSLKAWTGLVDGVPVCMFGVSEGEHGEGRPWMVGTGRLDDPLTAMIFLRRCRKRVEIMLNLRPVLANYVSVENVRAVAWLGWLGFSFSPPFPWGKSRQMFRRFEMRRGL